MEDMRHMYSPPGFNTEAASTLPKAFQLKYLNIMDPLLPTNNLGRSVNKSSFARIRRALEYGANRLSRILKMVSACSYHLLFHGSVLCIAFPTNKYGLTTCQGSGKKS